MFGAEAEKLQPRPVVVEKVEETKVTDVEPTPYVKPHKNESHDMFGAEAEKLQPKSVVKLKMTTKVPEEDLTPYVKPHKNASHDMFGADAEKQSQL